MKQRGAFLRSKRVHWVASLLLATAAWVPSARFFFEERTSADDAATAKTLSAPFANGDPRAFTALRRGNPEWDLMGRLYLGLGLANRALATADSEGGRAEKAEDVRALDAVIADTEGELALRGQGVFMLPYKDAQPWISADARSVFVDGEVLFLEASRALAAGESPSPRAREHAASIVASMNASPTFSAESYPDEAWTFCNTTALAALSVYDVAAHHPGSSDALATAWVTYARAHLIDERTGLLITSFTRAGLEKQGPEGSSLFMAAHSLRFFDDAFAKEQYELARKSLVRDIQGFAFAEEWPRKGKGKGADDGDADIDSGPVVPIFHASAGASGLSVLGAHAFDDRATSVALERSLAFIAFEHRDDDGHITGYGAGNVLGDALVVYARSFGPLLGRVKDARALRVAKEARPI